MVQTFNPGDEVIVTNCDHEANIGPWVRMQEKGITVKSWNINPETFRLELDDLDQLMNKNTRLVAFTHVSNILGTINPVKEITRFVHDRGALVCVDGVAYAPHRLVDVKELDVDFYVFSLYKVYGPHYALLYGKQELFEKLPGINHFFIDEVPYKLQPGNVNYELSYGLLGIADYFLALAGKMEVMEGTMRQKIESVFQAIKDHEEILSEKVLDFLSSKENVQIIGEKSTDKNIRVPTVSFVVRGKKSSDITLETDKEKIAIRYGDFYARRLIESLGLMEQDGVVRISLVHYNTFEEVDNLIHVLDRIL
jgi:cysteine desulfurase family protein (TIGR01976 family)